MGAIALAIVLVVSSLTLAASVDSGGSTPPDAGEAVDAVETGMRAEMEAGADVNASNRATPDSPAGAEQAAGPGTNGANQTDRARDADSGNGPSAGAFDNETRRRIQAVLASVVRGRQDTGSITDVEPSTADVAYGRLVILGANGTGPVTNRRVRLRTADRRTATLTTTGTSPPGPDWERGDRVGTAEVATDSRVADARPGPAYERVETLDRIEPAYRYTNSSTRPGEEWIRLGPAGTTTRISETTVARSSPGADWTVLETVAKREPLSRTTTATTKPGPGWTRTGTVDAGGNTTVYRWRQQLHDGYTLRRYGHRTEETVYRWASQTETRTAVGRYERRVERPSYEWTKTTSTAVPGVRETRIRAAGLAPDDAPLLVFGGANGTRDSTLTLVTGSLPVGSANATTLRAVPNGSDPAAVDDADDWSMRVYQNTAGDAVVSAEGRRSVVGGPTVRIGLDGPTVNGSDIRAPAPAAATPTPFDLYLRNASGVYGAYSLFATNLATTELDAMSNVTVRTAVDTATVDVTYQNRRTTYTDTVTITPDHAVGTDVTVGDDDGGTNRAPNATIDATEIARNDTHVVYRLDGSGSTDDGLITEYNWTVGAYADRASGLVDGQVSQRIAAERRASDYAIPFALTITDDANASDTAVRTISIPGDRNTPPTASLTVRRVSRNDTHTTFEVDPSGSTDPDGTITDYTLTTSGNAPALPDRATAQTYTVERRGTSYEIDVTLTVSDDSGASDATTRTVTVSPTSGTSVTATLSTRRLGTTPDRVLVRFDASASTPAGVIDDYRWYARGLPENESGSGGNVTLDGDSIDVDLDGETHGGRFGDLAEITVRNTSDNGSVVTAWIERHATEDAWVTATVTAVDDTPDHNVTDNASQGLFVPGQNGDGWEFRVVPVRPRDRSDPAQQFRIETAGPTEGRYEWSVATHDGRVRGLRDAAPPETFRALRVSSDYRLTVEGTKTVGGTETTHTETVRVRPARSPRASITVVRSRTNESHYRYVLDAGDSRGSGYTWAITDNRSAVAAPIDDDARRIELVVERPPWNAPAVDVPVELTVTKAFMDGVTETDAATRAFTVEPRDSPPGVNLPPDARLSVTEVGRSGDRRTLELDASASSDPDGTVEHYRYLVLAGSQYLAGTIEDDQTTQTVEIDTNGDASGRIQVRLLVEDDDGATDWTVDGYTWDSGGQAQAPTADLEAYPLAGGNGSVQPFELDATGSSDDGRIVDYRYAVVGGVGSLNESLTDGVATQTVGLEYVRGNPDARVKLTVEDDQGLTDSTVANLSYDPGRGGPVAQLNATIEANLSGRRTYRLDATGSHAPGADEIVSYDYRVVGGHGEVVDRPVDNRSVTAATVTLVDRNPDAVIQLEVTDSDGGTDTAVVELSGAPSTENEPPVAKMSSKKVPSTNSTATKFKLNSSRSYDPDGSITMLDYEVVGGYGTVLDPLEDGEQAQLVTVNVTTKNPDAVVKLTLKDDDGRTNTTTESLNDDLQVNVTTPRPEITSAGINDVAFVDTATPAPGDNVRLYMIAKNASSVSIYIDGSYAFTTQLWNASLRNHSKFESPYDFSTAGTHNVTFVARGPGGNDTATRSVYYDPGPDVKTLVARPHHGPATGIEWPYPPRYDNPPSLYNVLARTHLKAVDPDGGRLDIRYEVPGTYFSDDMQLARFHANDNGNLVNVPSGNNVTAEVVLNTKRLDTVFSQNITAVVTDDEGHTTRHNVTVKRNVTDVYGDSDLDVDIDGWPARNANVTGPVKPNFVVTGDIDGPTPDVSVYNIDFTQEIIIYGPGGNPKVRKFQTVNTRQGLDALNPNASLTEPGEYHVRAYQTWEFGSKLSVSGMTGRSFRIKPDSSGGNGGSYDVGDAVWAKQPPSAGSWKSVATNRTTKTETRWSADDLRGTGSPVWQLGGPTRSKTTKKATNPGDDWTKVSETGTNALKGTYSSSKPPKPSSSCGDCYWKPTSTNGGMKYWEKIQTIYKWKLTETLYARQKTVTMHKWVKQSN